MFAADVAVLVRDLFGVVVGRSAAVGAEIEKCVVVAAASSVHLAEIPVAGWARSRSNAADQRECLVILVNIHLFLGRARGSYSALRESKLAVVLLEAGVHSQEESQAAVGY